ncbi:phage/plasmid primase, P4 family [uncultured Granulicatella sp.]|uniref:DNA primase family protein n=1 Tax=uncultured Granulicatella sp. TaxID=316089 RepID=UPI0028D9082D|nr:phage/plasmid primase, P4 family [uncultured Granulicatella sp.]
MPIYIEKGWFNRTIKEDKIELIPIAPIDWLKNYTPTRVVKGANLLDGDIEQMKEKYPYVDDEIAGHYAKMEGVKNNQYYFMVGSIERDEKNQLKRNIESIIRRSVITLDYDDKDTPSLDDLIRIIKEKKPNVECYIYPTIKYTDKFPRWRVVFETDRPLLKYEYKEVATDLAETIGIKYDKSVINDWQKFAGLPVVTPENSHIDAVYIEGEKLKTPDIKDMKPPIKQTEKITGEYASKFNGNGNIPHDDAIEIIKRYVAVNEAELMDYDKSVTDMFVIAKAISTDEIDYDTGVECVEILALGNTNWIHGTKNKIGNLSILHYMLQRGVYKNPWSFYYWFRVRIDRQFKKSDTSEEIKKRIREDIEQWKIEHEETKRDGTVKKPRPPGRVVADIMKRHCDMGRLGSYDADTRYLGIYNPDTGIYDSSEYYRKTLFRAGERSLTRNECKEILDMLLNEAENRERETDYNYIIFKNGIYNIDAKQLEPFSPNFVFESTIGVNYNPDADEPVFPDGWTFSKWIDIAMGGDEEKKKLLWQLIASTIHTNKPSGHVALLFSRVGSSGKSTFEHLLKNLVGKENTVALRLQDIEKRFDISRAVGKALVIGDDNSPKDYNADSANLKSMVTGEPLKVEAKGENAQTHHFNCQVVQSMNGLPNFGDVTDGLTRRLRIIEFKKAFKGKENNPNVKEKYIKDPRLLEWIAKEALEHLVLSGEWIQTEEHKQYIQEIISDSDPVARYFEERIPQFTSTRLPIKFLYEDFKAVYLQENNRNTKISRRTFTKQLKPYMEAEGWQYDKNNKKPLEAFHQADWQLYTDNVKEWDINYNYEKESRAYHSMFIKETDI